jgi:hypothetical protein
VLALQQAISTERDPVERIPHHGQVVAAGVCDSQPLALTVEKLQAEFGLQSFHLMADSPLRNAKLLRGSGEALVSRRGLK